MDVLQPRAEFDPNSFGKFRLIADLGRGGMATVHLAVMHGPAGFNKLVVVKQIRPDFAEDPEILGMFLDEAQLAARLRHPNVVQTNEVGQEGERHFMAMEYLEGQPLSRINCRLQRHGGLPEVLHLRVIADLLSGLHYAHELADYDGTPLGVVHRDVTPQNVFVTYEGGVKIVDFGVAKAENALVQTRVGIVKGKITYMAPEQARGEKVDRRADVFAVGVMLWEAATGARPWGGLPAISVLKHLHAGHFPAPRTVKADIPPALEAIILKAVAHERDDRYATAAELQADIEAYIETTGERLQQRALGKLVSHHFEPERAKIRAVIEQQLRASPSGAAAQLPIIDEATAPPTDPAARVSADNLPPQRRSSHPEPPPTLPAARTSAMTPAVITRPRGRQGLFVPAGILLAGAALILVSGLTPSQPPLKAQEATTPASGVAVVSAAPQASVAAAASPRTTVAVQLSALPREAHIFLDDVPLAGNPYRGDLPRDGSAHRLRIEAPGYHSRLEDITLDQARSVEVILVPRGNTPPGLGPTRANPRQRVLDNDNPYAP